MSNNEIRSIGMDGKANRADDEWWEQARRDYDVAGVPSELTTAARPLLEGNTRQQRMGHKFLMEHADSWNADTKAHMALQTLLVDQKMPVTNPDTINEDDFLNAWDEFSGPATGYNANQHSVATSKEAQANGLAQSGYPSGAGRATSQPSGQQFGQVAHFGD